MTDRAIVASVILLIFAVGFIAGGFVQSWRHKCPEQVVVEAPPCLPPVKPVNDTFGATTSALLENVERLKRCAVR